jgi:hypothetical protein
VKVSELVEAARSRSGLDDFGADTWQEGLEVLVRSFDDEAALTPEGEADIANRLVEKLVKRLEVEDVFKQHPEIADQQIVAPLFGLGLGRTGSNALGFVLSLDPARRFLRNWEAFSPCPPPEAATQYSDPRIAEAEARIEADARQFPDFPSMRPTTATGPDEDVYLLAFDFRSQLFEAWGRIPTYSEWLFACDMEPAYRYHYRVVQILQWHCPPNRWFLRTPCHMHAMIEFNRVYPDARYVMTHRDITAMIPSEAALFASLSMSLTKEPDLHYLGHHLSDVREEALHRLIAFRDAGNEHRFFDIGFADMQADPIGTVRRLYGWLGEDLTSETEARMAAWWDENSRDRQGSRRYDPEMYGVREDQLRERFRFYHERFPTYTRTR